MFGYEQQEELDQQAMEGLVLGLAGGPQAAEMGEALAAAYQDELNQYQGADDDVYQGADEGAAAASQSGEDEGVCGAPDGQEVQDGYAQESYGDEAGGADEQLDTTESLGEEGKLVDEIKDESDELPAADSTSGTLN